MLVLLLIVAQIDTSAAESVRIVIPNGRTHVVHIRDWHLVSEKDFSADTGLTGDELDSSYGKHIETVLAVQQSQRKILAKTRRVYIEGVSAGGREKYLTLINELKGEPHPDGAMLLNIGAAGQLFVAGVLETVPAEGDDFRKANPIKTGKFVLDVKANEMREDDIVRNLLANKGDVVLVLGGAHDLSDNIKRLSPDCGLTVITPKGWPE